VFHYAGHANDITLQLDNGNGNGNRAVGGIAKLLGQQTSLKLVFLSGCATAAHVKRLHDAGVPAVVIHEQQTSSIIINGQTGVIQFSPSSDEPALANLKPTLINQNQLLMSAATDQFSSWACVFIGIGIGFIIGLIMCLLIS
jgi:uncharacterized membrane protein YhaH (DUF805 family)